MKKSEQEILSILARELHSASGYIGGELVSRRKKSLEYYLGMPLGNEQEGRSQVVSNDVMDTVESLMPSLMKIFTSGDNVFACEGVGPEDDEIADCSLSFCELLDVGDGRPSSLKISTILSQIKI